MPSFTHELLVELFRSNGELAVELLRACAGIAVEHQGVALGSIDLSQVVPTEYRADAVIVLRGPDSRPVTGVIVEVQRQVEPTKLWTWPAYVATLRARITCAAVLLVIAPDPAVAAWARRAIELGHPGFRLAPIVIGFEDVPRIVDRTEASRLPELAVLSALAHPTLEIAEAAISAVSPLPNEQARLYLDVIMGAVPAALRKTLEARMRGPSYKSDFVRNYVYQTDFARKHYGAGLRDAVRTLANAKFAPLEDADLAAVEALSDQLVLKELIDEVAKASSLDEVRRALARATAANGLAT